ncbi:MAG: M56 family metallopeptidase [Planctomycetes bacterium]|nr:M56 family metallopeptidase [Planctomycetota bacterium]
MSTSAMALAADWVCTFALHSTCALAAALAIGSLLGKRAVLLQEQIARFALWLALPTSVLQCFVLGGTWVAGLAVPIPASMRALGSVGLVERDTAASAAGQPALLGSIAETDAAPSIFVGDWWPPAVVGSAVLAALVGLAWFAVLHRRLRAALASRVPETDARVLATAAQVAGALGLHQSPHLSTSSVIATPIAFGWMRPEICLPERAVELSDESLRAMLAHEVAHLRRGDPAWTWGLALVQATFPWQILTVAVRRRWTRLVELRCDAIAAGHSSPTAVARCLLDVAEWLRPGSREVAFAPGMAARAAALRERVHSALQAGRCAPPSRAVAAAWSAASFVALTVAGPGIGTHERATPESPLFVFPEAAAPAPSALTAAIAALDIERSMLRDEAARLRADLGARAVGDVRELMAALERRLDHLERTSTRLHARLARSPSEAR